MCFAPRYISGTIAGPFTDCRKTASLPDTPCALNSGASTTATRNVAATATHAPRYSGDPLVFGVALGARIVNVSTGVEEVLRVPGDGRAERRLAAVDHRFRERRPVALVD